MATAGFTFMGTGGSGYDPFMSNIENKVNLGASKKSAAAIAKIQYHYAQQYALNSPAWNVQGLRNAGLNPILAATGGQMPSASGIDAPMQFSGDGSGANISVNPQEYETQKNAKEKQRAEIDLINAQKKNLEDQGSAAVKNAESNQWLVVNARDEGFADWHVKYIGAGGKIGVCRALRINKVTGETYDAISGRRVQVVNQDYNAAADSAPSMKVAPSPRALHETRPLSVPKSAPKRKHN